MTPFAAVQADDRVVGLLAPCADIIQTVRACCGWGDQVTGFLLMPKVLFLPGAGASAAFWRPVAHQLDLNRELRFFAWPGLGNEPHDPRVRGTDDLVAMVLSELGEPADIVAQSMGGLVAIRVALNAPQKVRRLVLTATSAGVPVGDLGGSDWRATYRQDFPEAAYWITEAQRDFSDQLGLIDAPTLLLWGDSDCISPPAVGHHLLALLPSAKLHIIQGAGHEFVQTHAAEVALLIADHLR